MDSCVISDPLRVPVTAQRVDDGRILVRAPGRSKLLFSVAEIERLAAFAGNKATIQRYPMRLDSDVIRPSDVIRLD